MEVHTCNAGGAFTPTSKPPQYVDYVLLSVPYEEPSLVIQRLIQLPVNLWFEQRIGI